jgi:glycosidase
MKASRTTIVKRIILGALALGSHLLLMNTAALAQQTASIERIEPPSWWVGMAGPELQLMIHGERIAELRPRLLPHPGVSLQQTHRVENPNYLFLDLQLDPQAQPGEIELRFDDTRGKTVLTRRYALQAREPGSAQRQGFGPRDAIYLVVPDRFAQGDPARTARAGLREGLKRGDPSGRHGGDLQGLRQHLDYIAGMGFTQIWPTPLSENDSAAFSYHGYAATDFYRVDPRFGSNEDYRALVSEARAKGLGVIQDIVLNHIGSQHWWMRDLPSADWLNQWPAGYTETHHARVTVQDLYAADSDRRRFTDGWFSMGMPDLNQRQPLLARYLTQMSLWWIEYAGLSGIRTDTYSYSDKHFLAAWSARLMQEYPRLNIVGEEWSPHPAIVSYWQRGKHNHDGYVSHAPSLMDFPLYGALLAGLNEPDGGDGGLMKLYEALAHDFVYPDPANLVLFEGNHDTPRLYSVLHEDLALTNMAWAYLAVTRRIPQFFYGSELLLTSPRQRDDGAVRADFPGGWAGDSVNGISGQGLSPRQREAQDWLRRLLNWRKSARAVHEGRLTHYAPMNGVYVLFRHLAGEKTVMLVLNKNKSVSQLDSGRFAEVIGKAGRGRDVLSGQDLPLSPHIEVPARGVLLLELGP